MNPFLKLINEEKAMKYCYKLFIDFRKIVRRHANFSASVLFHDKTIEGKTIGVYLQKDKTIGADLQKSKYPLKFKSSQKPNTDSTIRSKEKHTEEVII